MLASATEFRYGHFVHHAIITGRPNRSTSTAPQSLPNLNQSNQRDWDWGHPLSLLGLPIAAAILIAAAFASPWMFLRTLAKVGAVVLFLAWLWTATPARRLAKWVKIVLSCVIALIALYLVATDLRQPSVTSLLMSANAPAPATQSTRTPRGAPDQSKPKAPALRTIAPPFSVKVAQVAP